MKTINSIKNSAFSLGLAVLCLLATNASSQVIIGPPCNDTNTLKFFLPPQTSPSQGFDVKDSRKNINGSTGNGIVLADDFLCTNTGYITGIHVWGSWLNDANDNANLTNFWIGIYSDVPATTNSSSQVVSNSHPGTLLWSNNFSATQFFSSVVQSNLSEFVYDPTFAFPGGVIGNDSQLYQYCFYPAHPFYQTGTVASPTIYWLAIRAQFSDSSTNLIYGWKSSAVAFRDPAVWGEFANGLPLGNWQSIYNPNSPAQPTQMDLSMLLTTSNAPPTPCVEANDAAKYDQEPNLFGGYDVWNSTPRPPPATDGPWVAADDFVCNHTGQITDLHLWGSWYNNLQLTNQITFTLGVYDNVPTNAANPYSHPGNLLWSQTFTPGQYAETLYGTGTETFLDPGPPISLGPENYVYYYCFNPTNLYQTQGQTYWFAAFATLPAGTQNGAFGWKTTAVVSNDISVHAGWAGILPPSGFGGWLPTFSPQGQPLDLAFKVTTPTNTCTPTYQCPTPTAITVPCGTAWSFTGPTVNDPCCGYTVTTNIVTNTLNPCSTSYTATFTIADCNGIFGSCSQTVTVTDTNAPLLSNCGTNITVPCGSSWSFTMPTASYPCAGGTVPVGILSSNVVGNACRSTNTIVWIATNQCTGAYSTCTQVVTVVDTSPPIFTSVPSNIVVYTCATNAVVTWTYTATDCSGLVALSSTPPSGTSFWTNTTTTVVITATNLCDNLTSNYTFTVKVLPGTNCNPVVCVESDYEKYVQGPKTIGGYDVWNQPYVLADDFVCTNTGPISDIHLWGSWNANAALTNSITFWLGIYNDIPAVTNVDGHVLTNSYPGTNLLWQQWFRPGQYAETIWTANASEYFIDPGTTNCIGSDSVVWYYCFYPTNAFQQLGTPTNRITYWLAAYALQTNGNYLYGWKTTTNVSHDISVHAIWPGFAPTNFNPGWSPNYAYTNCTPPAGGVDLAFKMTMCSPVHISRYPTNAVTTTNVVVTWSGGGYLQSATNVTGPYIDVPSYPTSPFIDYSVTPTNKFYRLRCY